MAAPTDRPLSCPKPLQPGDAIAVVAPAGLVSPDSLDRALELVRAAGYRVLPGRHLRRRSGYLAGTDAERAEDLIAAVRSPDATAVWCARGGYGGSRILQHLPFAALRGAPKIFLGFSDVTFLHAGLNRQAGWVTFHGPNLLQAAERPDQFAAVLETLAGRRPLRWALTPAQVLRTGSAVGPVVGGNLTCLIHLIGTPFFPDLDGRLLLLEDCGEACYRLDRHFNHLKMIGAFDRLAGLLLGQFIECGRRDEILDMIADHLHPFAFPIVSDLPFGHDDPNEIIALGSPFRIDTHELSLHAVRPPFNDRG